MDRAKLAAYLVGAAFTDERRCLFARRATNLTDFC
jgi:hypothetical protein